MRDGRLPIFIGTPEAAAIAYALQGVTMPRPMTHDLMRDVLSSLDVEIERVVITELQNATYYAELRLRRGTDVTVVSSRPSDAVAVAVRTGSPLYVSDELMDSEGIILAADSADDEDDEGEPPPDVLIEPVQSVPEDDQARGLRHLSVTWPIRRAPVSVDGCTSTRPRTRGGGEVGQRIGDPVEPDLARRPSRRPARRGSRWRPTPTRRRRSSIGVSTESTPSRATPRTMKGYTVDARARCRRSARTPPPRRRSGWTAAPRPAWRRRRSRPRPPSARARGPGRRRRRPRPGR